MFLDVKSALFRFKTPNIELVLQFSIINSANRSYVCSYEYYLNQRLVVRRLLRHIVRIDLNLDDFQNDHTVTVCIIVADYHRAKEPFHSLLFIAMTLHFIRDFCATCIIYYIL